MTFDSAGRIYVTTHLGLQVFDTHGPPGRRDRQAANRLALERRLRRPRTSTRCTSPRRRKVYKRKINAKGMRYKK